MASRSSPTSPTRPRKPPVPHGFLAPPKPRPKPITQLSVRELQDLHSRNARILSSPASSTSTYVQRISAEQAAIEARLVELVGVGTIQDMMRRTSLNEDQEMKVDNPVESPSHSIETKRRIIANFQSTQIPNTHNNNTSFSFQEAVQIEKEAHAQDLRRKQEIEDRKRRMGLPVKGEVLTRQEREARIWAFMNHKPTESDMEDDDDDADDSDDDPAGWFEDDQDDGRKGQDIVEPDYEELSSIIRIDEARIPRNDMFDSRESD